MTVKKSAKKWASVLGGVVFAGASSATNAATPSGDAATPYDLIEQRNVFDLRDIPAQIHVIPDPVLPRVYLTGIATVLDMKQAYLLVQAPAVPGRPAAPDKYMTLAEGQRQEMLEVLEINPKTKLVTINNSGRISTITFESNRIPVSGKLDIAVAGNSPAAGPIPGQTGVGFQNKSPGAVIHSPPQQPDPAQQIVLMELQREASKSQVGAGQLPPLPPTPLSEILQQELQQQAPGGAPTPLQPNFPGQHNTLK